MSFKSSLLHLHCLVFSTIRLWPLGPFQVPLRYPPGWRRHWWRCTVGVILCPHAAVMMAGAGDCSSIVILHTVATLTLLIQAHSQNKYVATDVLSMNAVMHQLRHQMQALKTIRAEARRWDPACIPLDYHNNAWAWLYWGKCSAVWRGWWGPESLNSDTFEPTFRVECSEEALSGNSLGIYNW